MTTNFGLLQKDLSRPVHVVTIHSVMNNIQPFWIQNHLWLQDDSMDNQAVQFGLRNISFLHFTFVFCNRSLNGC